MRSGAWLVWVFFTIGAVRCGADKEGEPGTEECPTQSSIAAENSPQGAPAASSQTTVKEQETSPQPGATTAQSQVSETPLATSPSSPSSDAKPPTNVSEIAAEKLQEAVESPSHQELLVNGSEDGENSTVGNEPQGTPAQSQVSQTPLATSQSSPLSDATLPTNDSQISTSKPQESADELQVSANETEAGAAPTIGKEPQSTTTSKPSSKTATTSAISSKRTRRPATTTRVTKFPDKGYGVVHDEKNCSVKFVMREQETLVTQCRKKCKGVRGPRPRVPDGIDCVLMHRRGSRKVGYNGENCAKGECTKGKCLIPPDPEFFNCTGTADAYADTYAAYKK